MEVAVTADAHLKTREETPFRYAALEDILHQISARDITNLLIAGDLFDTNLQDVADFESLSKSFAQIQLHIIPGNHDAGLSERTIVGDNVHIYAEPTVLIMDSLHFLLVPFESDRTMGEQIASYEDQLGSEDWVLVGHGNYLGGTREINPLEPGTYMPITRRDLERFAPRVTFLGHIHKPTDVGSLHYPGSSCGMDISETGKRRYLIFDTADYSVISNAVNTQVLYFDETFLVVPSDNEITSLKGAISNRIAAWNIDESDIPLARIRVRASGYSSDRNGILNTLEESFGEFSYYKSLGPMIDDLLSSQDSQLNAIAERTLELVDGLDWDFGGAEPLLEQVKTAALEAIFDVRGQE